MGNLLYYIITIFLFIVVPVVVLLINAGIETSLRRERIKQTDFKKIVKVKKYEKFMANYKNIMKSLESGETIDLVEDHEIEELLHDKKENILKEFYNIFLEVQKALTNCDYDKLKELCTDELYNMYKAQADTLELSNKKFVKNTYELIAEEIVELEEEKDVIIIGVLLKVLYNDLVVKKGREKELEDVLFTNDQAYKLTFVIGKGNKDTCPNCGAILEDSKIRECPYCKSHVTPKPYHYALSSVDIIESNVDTIE